MLNQVRTRYSGEKFVEDDFINVVGLQTCLFETMCVAIKLSNKYVAYLEE